MELFVLFPPPLDLLDAILDLSVTTTPILPFGACDVIMHKVHRSGIRIFRTSKGNELDWFEKLRVKKNVVSD